MAVRPTTQSYAVSKGVELGGKVGVLNLSYERVRSVSDIASPYTSYVRNAFGVRYSNSLHTKTGKTLSVDFSLNGNVGGNNTEADPDAFKETYTKSRDNALWSSLSFNYMLNSPWLSNLRGGVTFSYADNRVEEKKISRLRPSSLHCILPKKDILWLPNMKRIPPHLLFYCPPAIGT